MIAGASAAALLAIATGCGGPPAGPDAPGQVSPVARGFCAALRAGQKLPASAREHCEDFTTVADGALPSEWMGGDGLLVKAVPSGRALVSFEHRDDYKVVLTQVVPERDFVAQAQFVAEQPPGMSFKKNVYTLGVGGHQASVIVADDVGCVFLVNLDGRASSKPAPCPAEPRALLMALSRQGDVLRIHIDGVETVMARLPGQAASSTGAVSFSARIAAGNKAGFELRGVRAVWFPASPAERDAGRVFELIEEGRLAEAETLSQTVITAARQAPPVSNAAVLGFQARAFVLAASGDLVGAEGLAGEADRRKLPPLTGRTIRASVATYRCDFVGAAELYLANQADEQASSQKAALNSLARLDIQEARYERALTRLDAARAQPNSGTALESQWDRTTRLLRAAALVRLGRVEAARAELPRDEFVRHLDAYGRGARWMLARRAGLYQVVQTAIGTLLGLHAYDVDERIPAWRALLADALAAYATDTSPCHDRFPDPVAAEAPAVRLLLLGEPPSDRDGDGTADASDRCPDRPEVINGIEDDDGCPDEAPGKLVGREIRLREELPFEFDSADIDARGNVSLDWLAAFLKSHSDLAVSIEGHTDDVGDDAFNLDLSRRRARAVVAALIARGIAADRLEHTGYGERLPKIPGRDKAARTANRRVEIITHPVARTR